MAAVCEVCGKHPSWGMSVSHSHRRTKRRWNPNIQRVRALVDGAPKRVHVCTGCIKSGNIEVAACQINAMNNAPADFKKDLPDVLKACIEKFGAA